MDKHLRYRLKNCVWEITLACDAKCIHCGSSAGVARNNELDTQEALQVVDDLSRLGCTTLNLSGGEPLIRADWPVIAAAARKKDIRCSIVSNGLLAESQTQDIAAADLFGITFSVDGTEKVHDYQRGIKGAFNRLMSVTPVLAKKGVKIGAVTQINKMNLPMLDEIHEVLCNNNFDGWQLQITIPRGRAISRRADLCIEPQQLKTLEKNLLEIMARTPLLIQTADNIGYMGRNEPKLRYGHHPNISSPSRFWIGCQAGLKELGITSDGSIRGCLSMPSAFDEGNVRERSLWEIWNDPGSFAYNRQHPCGDLNGTCGDCDFGKICRGGCTSLAYATTGDIKSNPYCLRKVEEKWS